MVKYELEKVVSLWALIVFSVLFSACSRGSETEEVLAVTHCSSCHLMPEPGLLSKQAWQNVLPEMGFRMGLKNPNYRLIVPAHDSAAVNSTVPHQPLVTEAEWNAIRGYYLSHAPDSLPLVKSNVDTTLRLFQVIARRFPGNDLPFVSLVQTDTMRHATFVGTRSSTLYQLGKDLQPGDSIHLDSPPSFLSFEKDRGTMVSLLGILEPNEQALGALTVLMPGHKQMLVIDSLQRPVYFEKTDFNNDLLVDYLVCEFGNYTGALTAYENLGDGHFKKHILWGQPGARKVVIRDTNGDGKMDIVVLMAQGNEQIALLVNEGNFRFTMQPLLRFPPVYGLSYFELIDFNRDGHFDILCTNGDNGDYSNVLKPYHGIRIFLNDGMNKFSEEWFYPMYGASKAIARDFDKDGDLDIAAISFFPDFQRHPEQGFLYFENKDNLFVAHSEPMAAAGRWLVMDAADIDQDGDCDLLLGAFDLPVDVPPAVVERWSRENVSLLIFINTVAGKEPGQNLP